MSLDSTVPKDDQAEPDTPKRSSLLPRALFTSMTGLVLLASATLIVWTVVWAIGSGANTALSILVGYGALASTLAIVRTPSAAQRPEPEVPAEPASMEPETSEAWKFVNTFTVSDASRLWCNIEPGSTATQDSMAWGRALIDAIKEGELELLPRARATDEALKREREHPHYMTQLSREALKAWAQKKGQVPRFLEG
jgi:hypothetical protein